jgi:membrane-associated phospholipid phosphatase
MHQPRTVQDGGQRAPAIPSSTSPAGNDPLGSQQGRLSRTLDQRFAALPPIIPLVAIVIVGYLGMVAALVGTGHVIMHGGAFAGLRGWDDDVTSWIADHRTAFLDTLTAVLSRGADTIGVVAFAIVVETVLVVQRRWWALVIVPLGLGLELVTFLTVNAVIGRPRPAVPKLGSEPSTSSYPSGHTAATIVLWGAVALLFCTSSTHRRLRSSAYTIVVVLACAVGTARVYRGMHHPSDVIAGGMMGLAALAVTVLAVRVASADAGAPGGEPDDPSAMRQDPRLPAVST